MTGRDWGAYALGVATPFLIIMLIALIQLILDKGGRLLRRDRCECALCHKRIGGHWPRGLLVAMYRFHRLTPAHRRNMRGWPQGKPGSLNADDRSLPATFDRWNHPTRINGRNVLERYGNGVYLLEDSLLRIKPAWRKGDRLQTDNLANITLIPLDRIETYDARRRVGRHVVITITGSDGSVIRITSPTWEHWRLMPHHGEDWARQVTERISRQRALQQTINEMQEDMI